MSQAVSRSPGAGRPVFSHHAELASLSPEDQDLWLDRAEAGGLSVRALRSELREARRRIAAREARATLGASASHLRACGGDAPAAGDVPPSSIAASGKSSLGSAKLNGHLSAGPGAGEPGNAGIVCPHCGHHFDALPTGRWTFSLGPGRSRVDWPCD
jgi:hypothetical protein